MGKKRKKIKNTEKNYFCWRVSSKQTVIVMMFSDPADTEKEKYDDLLPDTNIDRERTLTGKWALFVFVISVGFTTLAFVTPNWIEGDPKFYGTKVERFGLWVHCLRSLPDAYDYNHQKYYAGCRWLFNPFTEGYREMQNILAPRKTKIIFILFQNAYRIFYV